MKLSDWIFPGAQVCLAGLVWAVAMPDVPIWEIPVLAVLAVAGMLLSGDRFTWGPRFLTRLAMILLIVGGTTYIQGVIPARGPAVWVFVPLFGWFCGRVSRAGHFDLAFLSLVIGLGAAPFTELHLERNLYTLIPLLFFWLESIRSGSICYSRRQLGGFAVFSAFITWGFIGVVYSVYPYITLRFTGILLFDFLVFAGVVHILNQEVKRNAFFLFLLTLIGTYPLFALAAAIERSWFLGVRTGFLFRLFVFARHPNYTIMPVLFALPIWIRFLHRKQSPGIRLAAALGAVSGISYILFFSYSRQGWLLMAVYGILLIPILFRTVSRKVIMGILSVLGLGFYALAMSSNAFYFRLTSIVDLTQNHRYHAWKVFWELIQDQPWIGYGLGTNRYIYPQAFGAVKPTLIPTRQFLFEAHNAYIDIFTGMGLVGLLIFGIFLFVTTRPHRPSRSYVPACWYALGIGIWMDLFFNFRFHAQDTGVMLMVALGLLAARKPLSESQVNISKSVSRPLQGSVVVLITVFALLPWLGKSWVDDALDMLKDGQWNEISRVFRRASLIEPLKAHPHYYLYLCEKQKNDPAAAAKELETAVKLCPNFGFYRYNLAVFYSEIEQFDKTLEHLQAAKILEPYDQEGKYRFLSGLVNRKMGNLDEARNDFWYAILLNPDLIKDDYWDRNPKLYRELISDFVMFSHILLDRNCPKHYYVPHLIPIARILTHTDLADQVGRLYQGALARYSGYSDIVSNAGLYYIDQKELDLAEKALFRGLVTFQDKAEYYNILGYIYLMEQKYESARYVLEYADRNWENYSLDNLFGLKMLVRVYVHDGDQEKLNAVNRKIKYLENNVFQRHYRDQTVHNGTPLVQLFTVQTPNEE